MKDRHIDLSTFKKTNADMVARNEQAWNSYFRETSRTLRVSNYTPEEIRTIIDEGTLSAQQQLSRAFFEKKGLYKRIILYYATLLTFDGLLIPNPSFGKKLSTSHIAKRYDMALNFLDKIPLKELFTRISVRALTDGGYYGVINTLNKDNFVLFDLPSGYCRSNFKDVYGNDIVEFDVRYFYSIVDEEQRKAALRTYPKIIADHFRKYDKGKAKSKWVILPAEIGVCFQLTEDGRPFFLNVIPATIQYDDAVDTEREKELEEIRKILVQKVPHLQDGQLLFEPDEAVEMHLGAVGMLKGNKNLSVLTTYTDVDAIVSKTSADNVNSSLEKMLQNVYSEAGASMQIFAATGTQAIIYSIKNDISLMMLLGNKYGRFVGYVLNKLFSNSNISFKYAFLPISLYTQADYAQEALKMAQSGYSFLLPAIAYGMSQSELSNIKSLENDVLKLNELLIPLASSFNQAAGNPQGTGEVGRPAKKLEEKAKKTIQNEDAIDHQGGSNE